MPSCEPGRDPLLRDGVIAVTIAVAMLLNGTFGEHARGVDALGALAVLVTTAPLIARGHRPELVLGVVSAGIFACMATLKPVETIALAPMVAAYTVAERRGRTTAIRAGIALFGVVVLATVIFNPHPGALYSLDTIKNLGFVGLPLILGVGVRDRRAWVCATRERAEQAEQAREEETLRRVGEERLRIAREVHDVVAHAMVAINVQAGVAAHVIDRRPTAARDALTEIKRVSGESLSDLRRTLGVLREAGAAPTRPAPGVEAVAELVEGLRVGGADVVLQLEGVHEPPVPVGTAAYRVVQEALTNALRHAPGAKVSVKVVRSPHGVQVDVRDEGAPEASVAAEGSGHGMAGMRERVASVNGTLEAGPHRGGWRVHAWLPGRATAAAGTRA